MVSRAKSTAPDLPPFPWLLDYLWDWFCQLSMGLTVSGMAPSVVTWEALESWARQMDVELEPREAVLLVELGQLRAQVLTEEKPKNTKPERAPRAPRKPRR
jgi:hypothetical protein